MFDFNLLGVAQRITPSRGYSQIISAAKGGGVWKMLTLANKGGEGFRQMLTLADKEGRYGLS